MLHYRCTIFNFYTTILTVVLMFMTESPFYFLFQSFSSQLFDNTISHRCVIPMPINIVLFHQNILTRNYE